MGEEEEQKETSEMFTMFGFQHYGQYFSCFFFLPTLSEFTLMNDSFRNKKQTFIKNKLNCI